MNYTCLISAKGLRSIINHTGLVIFDCRHDLFNADFGWKSYSESHIPTAVFASVDQNLSGEPNGKNGRHPLPDIETFCNWLGDNGVSNESQVIAYDSSGGMYGARLWWMLRWMGHQKVAVLNGGWQAWLDQSYEVNVEKNEIVRESFTPDVQTLKVDEDEILNASPKQLRLIDARTNSRFHGIGEKLDPVGGHIPGALNRYFENNLDNKGFFKSGSELKEEFSRLIGMTNPRNIVHTCGSGISACHNLIAMEASGLKGSRLYPGSWSAWISDEKRPIAR